MRNHFARELNEAMDQLTFSPEDKQRMVKNLTQARPQAAPRKAKSSPAKRMLAVALVAAAALATLTGAAVFTRWSSNAQSRYNPSQQIKDQAKDSGLSVMLDGKSTQPSGQQDTKEVLSTTDQGITVTAVQTIADEYGCELTFRVEGFQLPEGRYPDVWPSITIDGRDHIYSSMSYTFFDGIIKDENGSKVYASNRKPVEMQNGSYVPQYIAPDGSVEFTIWLQFRQDEAFRKEVGTLLGKEIQVHLAAFGQQSTEKAGMPEKLVEGSWDLRWTLTGADSDSSTVTIAPNTVIGDSDLTLLDMEIGQKSVHATYKLAKPWDGWKQMDTLSPNLEHIRLKNGTCVSVVPSQENYEQIDQLMCEITYTTFEGMLDLSQLDALAYHKGWETDADGNRIQTFTYIPIG